MSEATNRATYESLSDALSVANDILEPEQKKGGMTIKYVQSSDNKYIQYRLMAQSFSTIESDWQGVDSEPVAGSKNLIESGEVFTIKLEIENQIVDINSYDTQNGSIGTSDSATWENFSRTKHIIIPIIANTFALITANSNNNTYYCFLADYQIPNTGDSPSYANGYDKAIIIIAGDSQKVAIPYDAKYLYIQTEASRARNMTPSEIKLLQTSAGGLKEHIDDIENNITSIISTTLQFTKTDGDELLSREEEHYGYTIKPNGDLYGANYMCLAFENKGCSKIEAYLGSAKTTNSKYAIGFYNSKTPSSESFISGIEMEEVSGSYIYKGPVPSNAVLIVACSRNATLNPESVYINIYGSDKTIINYVDGLKQETDSEIENINAELEELSGAKVVADDIEYVGTINIFNPSNFVDGYKINYSGDDIGEKSSSNVSSCTNTPIQLDSSVGVSIQTKLFGTLTRNMNLDVFLYDANGDYMSHQTVAVGSNKSYFLHFTAGASYIMFAFRYWITNFGEGVLPSNVMIWQTDSNVREPWIDYGSSKYTLNNLVIENSKKRIDQYDGQIINIAYSSLVRGYPINTKEHFIHAISLGYNSIKGDMRLTSDGGIVLCHDAGYTLDENGRITTFDSSNCTLIHDMTLSEVLSLEYASVIAYGIFGYYPHPCTLDDMLLLCKEYDIVPYITFRAEYIEDTATLLYAKLQKYGLVTKAIINLYNALACIPYLIALDKNLIMCYTFDKYSSTNIGLRDQIDTAAVNGCSIACMRSTDIDESGTTYDDNCAAYAISKGVRLYAWGVGTYSDYYNYISKGLCGFQITADVGLKCLTPAALTMRLSQT